MSKPKNETQAVLENISALRIDLYDCTDKPPRDYMRNVAPTNALRYAWIPITMGDQIWVLYEFASPEDRASWERSLPTDVSRWLDRRLLPHALEYG